MGEFVELGCEGINHLVEKHWEKGWDYARRRNSSSSSSPSRPPLQQRQQYSPSSNNPPPPPRSSRRPRTSRNSLPPPPPPPADVDPGGDYVVIDSSSSRRKARQSRDDSLERESQTSERVIRAYEGERDDPRRKPETVLSARDLRSIPSRSRNMSNANGYTPYENAQGGGRARSQQPAGSRYYEDDEYGSDYDDRNGRRQSGRGRGYDDYDDRGYDREVIETERYRGPARNFPRQDSYNSRGNDTQYDGAVTQYRRSGNLDAPNADHKRSRSRGRRDRDRDDSRSRSRSRSAGGIRGRIDDHFDTSLQGLGVGIAGAVVGGLAGRQIGGRSSHRNRDILIGAVVGGLGANAAEHKWRDWKEEKKERLERDEDRWEQKWDGRSRSAMR